MPAQKLDADQIRGFLTAFAQAPWLQRDERRWWPRFVFHYTDLNNAVKVLQDGYLYCRGYLEEKKRLPVDSGSQRVLASTVAAIKEHVRLYFRPQTPTQFHVEGIRPTAALTGLQAHCPTPVFFLFDSAEILVRSDCRFSDGNLASQRAKILSTASQLEGLPWQKIYHTGIFNPTRDSDIIFHRNAEIVVPGKLDLNSLKYIYCRSVAEKETLMHLLPLSLRRYYERKVAATTRNTLFFRQYTFVESANLETTSATFRFSPDTRTPGPFHTHIELTDIIQRKTYQWGQEKYNTQKTLKINYPIPISKYAIRMTLDGHLAYANSYEELDIPF